MTREERDWQEEQQRVELVSDVISHKIAALQESVGDIKTEIVSIRKHFWDDVTVNFDDAHEAAETYASVKQQAEVLSERERSHQHAQKQLKALQRLQQSPYFARIDFREEGEQEAERIYLGIASLLDKNEDEFLIYDWRAPISSLYYDYAPGPVQYETPAGKVTGTMELKRQLIIRGNQLHSMFDTGVTIGDELLKEVLGKQATPQMKSIVATIQMEQNRIIRNERSSLLLVQGAAGSGKTSAALQRVAYLLYRYRQTLTAEQIVLFSPNPMFNSYISTVLPELGEENMQQTTFQEYLELRLGKTFQLEDPFSQLEYIYTAEDSPEYQVRMAGIKYKSSAAFMRLVDDYIDSLGHAGLPFRSLTFRGRTLLSAEQMAEHFYSLDSSLRIANRIQLLKNWLLDQLKELARAERKKAWVKNEMELLSPEDYRRVEAEMRRRKRLKGETFDDFALEQKLLADLIVKRRFRSLRTLIHSLQFLDLPAAYRRLFTYFPQGATKQTLPPEWKEIGKQTIARLDRGELAYEDATPYLYLKERLEGFHTHTGTRHVFVDEVQDYSLFQLVFLKRLFPYSKMTLLGDLNQAIFAHTEENNLALFLSWFEKEATEQIILTRSYRSTKQIVQFTKGMVAGGDAIQPFNRDGRKPTVSRAADVEQLVGRVKERIDSLQAEGYKTIAIIGKTAQECREIMAAMKDEITLRLIDQETVTFHSGTLVIPAYLSKGIEFDAVIIWNASDAVYGHERERKLFYTACTRAMHELHIYYREQLSPFIKELSSDTYELQA